MNELTLVSNFLKYKPLSKDGFPNDNITISVGFEAGGTHETWGFVIRDKGKTIAEGRTLEQAIERAKENFNQ